MSYSDIENYDHDYDLLVNKGPQRKHIGRATKSAGGVLFTKTIYDPHNTLSKRAKNRLLADDSDLIADVPYSMNKQQRWKIDPVSLLHRSFSSNPETNVVEREIHPPSAHTHPTSSSVTNFHVLDDDVVTTLSAGGRKKTLEYFTKRLNEMRDTKEERDAAKILYNVYSLPSLPQKKNRRPKQGKRKRIKVYDSRSRDSSDEDFKVFEKFSGSCLQCEDVEEHPRTTTLGDFMTVEKSKSYNDVKQPSKSSEGSSFEIIMPLPAPLLDISKTTNAGHIFEIVEVELENFDTFSPQEEVKQLLPFHCTMECFDDGRVSVRSRPNDKPVFALFFEKLEEKKKLRIRFNTDTPYAPRSAKKNRPRINTDIPYRSPTREALFAIFQQKQTFSQLFHNLIEFIFDSDQPDVVKENSRFIEFRESFLPKTNSLMMAAAVIRNDRGDEFAYVESHYSAITPSRTKTVKRALLCRQCESSLHNDLFQTMDGFWCRECIASFVMHQLRLNQFPIQIPLASSNYSPLYLLYAILPVPVISLIIRLSHRFFYSLDYPHYVFTSCPRCSLSHTVPKRNDFNTCSCTDCGCYWCYRCGWEPHWPMTCAEYKEWDKKWSVQYWYEKYNLDKNERVLRMKCYCGQIYYAPEKTANGTGCPSRRCGCRYKDGLSRYWFCYHQWTWQYRVRYHKRGLKEGEDAQPMFLEPKKLIRKECPDVCTAARNERFSAAKGEEFEKAIKGIFSIDEAQDLIELRKLILVMIENSTAWLYLHRHEVNESMKHAVSSLYKAYLTFREQILNLGTELTVRSKHLRQTVDEIVLLFKKSE